jgi:hypothetical protein
MFIRKEFLVWILPDTGNAEPIFPTSIAVTTRINDIPTAVVTVAIGRNFSAEVSDEQVYNGIAEIQKWAVDRTLVSIRCRITEFDLVTNKSKQTERVVFLGYILAPSIQIVRQNASFTFQMQHWAVDLMAGSMLSHFAIETEVNQKRTAMFLNPTNNGALNKMENVRKHFKFPANWEYILPNDIWAEGFKRVLASYAAKSIGNTVAEAFKKCQDSFNAPPPILKSALQRIQGPTSGDLSEFSLDYDGSGGPVRIRSDMTSSYRRLLSHQIGKRIGDRQLTEYAKSTFWDATLRTLANYNLVFIPRALDAIVAPIHVGRNMNDVRDGDIVEFDQGEVSWTAFQQTQTRGVGIAASRHSQINPVFNDKEPTLFGCFVADTDLSKGQITFIPPPDWLSGPPSDMSKASTAADKANGVKSTAASGEVSSETQQEVAQLSGYLSDGYETLLSGWAKLIYLQQTLANRVLSVTTPVRFDIGVGSMVKLRLDLANMLAKVNLPLQSVAGMVVGTTLTINRDQQIATMYYQLDYVRTQDQLDNPKFNFDKHPVYEDTPRIIAY